MTDERDDLDRALAAGLGGLAADDHDPDAVLAGMRPGLQRARRRHRVARASVVVAVIAALAGAGALFARGPGEKRGGVEIAPTTIAGDHRGTFPPGPARTSTTVNGATPTTAASRHPTTTSTIPAADPSPNRGPGPNAGPGGTNSGSNNSGPSNGSVPPPQPSSTTTPPAATHTYTAPGGTVTIRFANGALTLVSYGAHQSYTATVHDNRPDRIEVRFSGPTDSRIRVDVDHGKLVEEQQ